MCYSKALGKLSNWNRQNLAQADQVSLTKSVVSSQPVYLLTALKATDEVLEELDKVRRKFLWAGDKAIPGEMQGQLD
jgi:hypothetical protein